MKVGICVPALGPHVDRRAVHDFTIRAEAAGFDSLWVQEHFMWRNVPQTGYAGIPGVPMPKPYQSLLQPLELLSYCAAITEKVELGTSILVTAYHRPLNLARRMATLDVLSGGRALCGLGLGWMAEEYAHMDTPFEKRGPRMTDFVRALKAAWLPDPVQYQGSTSPTRNAIPRRSRCNATPLASRTCRSSPAAATRFRSSAARSMAMVGTRPGCPLGWSRA